MNTENNQYLNKMAEIKDSLKGIKETDQPLTIMSTSSYVVLVKNDLDDGYRYAMTISANKLMIKVEMASLYQGEGYTFVIDKKYAPDINKSNAAELIDNIIYYKQTKDFNNIVVKFWFGHVPFAIMDIPFVGKNIII